MGRSAAAADLPICDGEGEERSAGSEQRRSQARLRSAELRLVREFLLSPSVCRNPFLVRLPA